MYYTALFYRVDPQIIEYDWNFLDYLDRLEFMVEFKKAEAERIQSL